MELCSKGNYLDLLIFNLDCMLSTFLLMNSSFNLPWHGQNLFRISCSQISNCFSKVHLDSKTWISELLLPIQRAHTYSNNLWIVVSEKHQFLAFERKGTAHFCMGGSDGAIIIFKTSLVCPFRKAQVRLCGHSKEEAVKMGPLVTLWLPALPSHPPCSRRFPAPGFVNPDLSYHHGNTALPRELPLWLSFRL